jgi:hypothetical protein
MNIRKVRWSFSPAIKCIAVMSFAAALLSGCLGTGATAPAGSAAGAREPSPPETGAARIASVNTELRFAVVDFSTQTMPPVGTRVNVYRGDKQVGTLRITEPVHAPLATADIIDGEARVGDEAR